MEKYLYFIKFCKKRIRALNRKNSEKCNETHFYYSNLTIETQKHWNFLGPSLRIHVPNHGHRRFKEAIYQNFGSTLYQKLTNPTNKTPNTQSLQRKSIKLENKCHKLSWINWNCFIWILFEIRYKKKIIDCFSLNQMLEIENPCCLLYIFASHMQTT